MMQIPKILIVDDEANILQSLRRTLRKFDVEVATTTSPIEALRLVQEQTFAVVISDQRMPEMEGTRLLEQVRLLSPDATRIILTGYADIKASMDAINKGAVYRYLNKPWDDGELRTTLRQAVDRFLLTQENRRLQAVTARQNAELKDLNENLKKKVMERTWEVLRLNQMLEQSFLYAVQAMARMAEMHGTVGGSHAKRVATLSKEVGKRMGLAGKDLLQLEVAATLHDIGKVQVDPMLLRKPEDQLEDAERAVLREHPVHGEAIVSMVPNLEDACRFVRHHHERFDGNGYPDGLSGAIIPIGARIIAAVNAYDKIVNTRTAIGVVPPAQALRIVQGRTSTEFDPQVVEALGHVVRELEGAAAHGNELEVELKDLRPGMVLSKNLLSSRGQLLLKQNSLVQQDVIDRLLRQNTSDPVTGTIHVYRKWPLRATPSRHEDAA